MTDHDAVNHPRHYRNHPSGIETIDLTQYMMFPLGNAFKCVSRHRDKGTPFEDLRKAQWYAKRSLQVVGAPTAERLEVAYRWAQAEPDWWTRTVGHALLLADIGDSRVDLAHGLNVLTEWINTWDGPR